jgi:uncharacterized membrane protein YphA (DoxX/SURF4 family)
MSTKNGVNIVLSLVRVAVGWHFLYEGLLKLLNQGWSSAGYLNQANWIFSNWFHQIAQSTSAIQFIDFMNIWGLIMIGAGLMLGIGIRWASLAGIMLLVLYYMVNPSLIGAKYNSISSEGSYLIVNKNIIEALVLLLIFIYPANMQIGLQKFLFLASKKIQSKKVQVPESIKTSELRRSFLQSLFVLPFAAGFGYAFYRKTKTVEIDAYTGATTLSVPDKSVKLLASDKLFSGSIANQSVSRLILGGGCLSGWQHARDLKYINELALAYNSNKRVFDTLQNAESMGINTINVFVQQMPLIHLYRTDYGGKLKAIVGVAVNKDDLWSEITQAVNFKADFIYIQPFVSDRLVFQDEADVLAKALEVIRSFGLPAGIGCFSDKTVENCLARGIQPDFYVKSIHPDNYWSANPVEHRLAFDPAFQKFHPEHNRYHDNIFDQDTQKTMSIMQQVKIPWIGFKTLASGAIGAKEGFLHAFEGGADFISVGMFDFQIERNIRTTIECLNLVHERKRNWYS